MRNLIPLAKPARVLVVGLLLTAGFSACLVADTVELSRGVQVDGEILRQVDQGKVPHLIIDLDPNLKIAIPKSRVRKTILDSDLKQYTEAVKRAGDDPDAHFELGRWCVKEGLSAQSEHHYRRAIELDPDHGPARRALKYAREGNQWVLYAELQRKRGMISVAGKWVVPEVYAREQLLEQADDQAKIWIREFARLRTTYLRGDKQSAEALQQLQAITDPLASQAFANALIESRGTKSSVERELRKLYVKKLGAFQNAIAVKALVETGLVEPDSVIRDLALENLQGYGAPSAVATYLGIVKNDASSPGQVRAALRGLNQFPEPELWRDYIDALVTTHKTTRPKGPGMSLGFDNRGGGGMTTGSKEEVIINKIQNAAARELLKEIAPGVDFGYDQMAWRKYFADQLMQTPGNNRRDP